MKKTFILSVFIMTMVSCNHHPAPVQFSTKISDNYLQLKKELLHGWNTWNTYSFLSHVYLPDGLSVNFYLGDKKSGEYLKNTFVWTGVKDKEVIWPGPHAIDGSYTELLLWWKGNAMVVKTATTGNDLVAAIIPSDSAKNDGNLVIHPAMLWNRPGQIVRTGNRLSAKLNGKIISVNVVSEAGKIEVNDSSYYNISLKKPTYLSTGKMMSVEQIKKVLHDNYEVMENEKEKHGVSKDAFDAIQTILAWNVIYDPEKGRMITPVSRMWNTGWGGYVLFCWGSEPYRMVQNQKSSYEMNNMQAAKFESGLDNSPMYDGIEFDTISHKMKLADVGLTSLYIADCKALADIALELGKNDIAGELTNSAGKYSRSLQKLWNNNEGIFLNKYTDNGEFSHRISPTNFYPLIARVETQDQAETMMRRNFYNPEKFRGEWIMPSIARSDSGYKDNEYWRGRIWAPMNFLVYLGLCNYDLPAAREDLSEKSMKLLMNEWLTKHHVHENYNAESGDGDDVKSSNAYYHWGALLGMIQMIQNNQVSKPLSPLNTNK